MAILFLQGPIGPFFCRLIKELRKNYTQAYAINFNGGDAWFNRGVQSTHFVDGLDKWPEFLTNFILQNQIRKICVYGDCRIYHKIAKQVAKELGCEFYVFEEGYLRPSFFTFEKDGANAYSSINLASVLKWKKKNSASEVSVGCSLWQRTFFCSMYYLMLSIQKKQFKSYQHHRNLSSKSEALLWLRAGIRFHWFRYRERHILNRLISGYKKKYFLFPLQVFNDSQIRNHSPYQSMEECIQEVIHSFAQFAPEKQLLVIKHHPMDRGHCDYSSLIRSLVNSYHLGNRVIYCHDLHLPTLLSHAKGVVTINSTTAISACYHKSPVKVLGRAFYNLPGICSQQPLKDFWRCPSKPNYSLFRHFRNYLLHHSQINGSFYKQIHVSQQNLIHMMEAHNMLSPQPLEAPSAIQLSTHLNHH